MGGQNFILKHKEQNITREKERAGDERVSPWAPTAASQVDVPHIRRGGGLVQFILRLGGITLLLTELLQTIEQHGLDLLLAGFETILRGEGPRPEMSGGAVHRAFQEGTHSSTHTTPGSFSSRSKCEVKDRCS